MSSTCEVGDASAEIAAFSNIKPNLPSGISVGYTHENNAPIFCLEEGSACYSGGDDADAKRCFKDQPEIHRLLSQFDINNFQRDPKKSKNVIMDGYWKREI